MPVTPYRPIDVSAAAIRRLIRHYQTQLDSQAPGSYASGFSDGAIRALQQVLEMENE